MEMEKDAEEKKAKEPPIKEPESKPEGEKESKVEKKQKQKRRNYSKYDFVKIKVMIEDHHFIFSRFLVSRILTLIKVQPKDAIKITLNLKKYLVDENMLEIDQSKMSEYLFRTMNSFDYGEHYTNRYKMISQFYQKRVPLLILVAGTACIGMSTLVTQLAERINISNILQTSISEKMMRSINPEVENLGNFCEKEGTSEEELLRIYERNCRMVRKGINFDMQKCFVDGKPLIVEGSHVNPPIFLKRVETLEADKTKKTFKIITPLPEEAELAKEKEPEKKMRGEMDKINQKGSIIIPFLLTIDESGHYLCIENRLSQLHKPSSLEETKFDNKEMESRIKILLRNYQAIQQHLLRVSDNMKVVQININSFEDTIDLMHNTILERIEEAYSKGEFQI